MGNRLLIIDVDALLGNHNDLRQPSCLRLSCNKDFDFLGTDNRCRFGKWCAHAHYRPEDVSRYRSVANVTADNCYTAVIPALEKLTAAGWLVSLWTTRPRRQTFHIISVLQEVGIWEKAQMMQGTPLLLNINDISESGRNSLATEKLALFEKVYGKECEFDPPLVAIESSPHEASILQSYTGLNAIVHLAPKTWLDILVVDDDELDDFLTESHMRREVVIVEQAS